MLSRGPALAASPLWRCATTSPPRTGATSASGCPPAWSPAPRRTFTPTPARPPATAPACREAAATTTLARTAGTRSVPTPEKIHLIQIPPTCPCSGSIRDLYAACGVGTHAEPMPKNMILPIKGSSLGQYCDIMIDPLFHQKPNAASLLIVR